MPSARSLLGGPARRIALLALAVSGAAFLFEPARGPRAAAAPADDEKAVRGVLDAQAAAWNKGDLDGFMAGYWDDDKLFYISGAKSVQGWKALKERYQKAYQGEGKEMGKLKFSDLTVEVLGPGVALARGRWEVTTSKEAVGGWFTLVFRKFLAGWKVVHDHTSK